MLALVIVDTVLVVLLAGLVAGLVRSHGEILRALHSLDARIREMTRPDERGSGGAEQPVTSTPVVTGKDRQ